MCVKVLRTTIYQTRIWTVAVCKGCLNCYLTFCNCLYFSNVMGYETIIYMESFMSLMLAARGNNTTRISKDIIHILTPLYL
ncbi:hypothetical protein BDV40DRAFT_251684 [Aspergillus tamarii]|uniref:Uncharacterized protein n=1 Tax=Aspergillus tamarii TaxID=41984 RepID=A0A5N6VC08_ASPTM|nr:hypothetical protein BDV40DRAFT_251684 [Aspergillus tamarii]